MSVSSVNLSPLGSLYINSSVQQVQKPKVEVCTSPVERISPEQKMMSIISPQELEKYYYSICNSLKLDVKPKLNLVSVYKEGWGGGFNFSRNEINLKIEDLVCSDYKIIGRKGNITVPIIEPKREIPLFASKELAEDFIKTAATRNNYGFDYIYIKPSTLEDKKRVILQKLTHELIHAQQHMLLRQTEGIGEKGIIRAWTHIVPKNNEEAKKLEEKTEIEFQKSYWADKTPTEPKIKRFSPQGFLMLKWLNSIRNYPNDINSLDYLANAIEMDAYKRSAQYVQMLFGPIKV